MESKLQCQNCRCPLTPPSGAATGMTCPRCTTWVEFAASCGGGCMSCFKAKTAHGEDAGGCCSAESSSVPASGEACKGNLLLLRCKRLFQRIFAVR